MALAIQIPLDEIEDALWRARYFSIEWFGESPLKLHSLRDVGDDGAPRLTKDFENYRENALWEQRSQRRQPKRIDLADDPRRRATKAFRRLRTKAPREFDAIYGMCVIDQVGRDLRPNDKVGLQRQFFASIRRTVQRLNQRKTETVYTDGDVLLLVVSGFRKVSMWAG